MVFHYKLFKPIILQVQGFFKDMTVQCFVLNTGQSVLQINKKLFKFLKLEPKRLLNCNLMKMTETVLKYTICVLYHHGSNS